MSRKDSSDYILAGRSVPLWLVVGGVIATLINSASLLGYAGSGYSLGVSAYFASFGGIAVMMWLGFWFIPRLRRANLTTVPELFNRFFGWPHKVVSVILVACRDMGVTAGASLGMAVVFQSVFDIPLDLALVITLLVTLLFTVTGGMWAVMITDTIQAVVILIGTTLMIPLSIAYIGGWDVLTNAIPETHWDLGNVGGSQAFAWIAASALTFIGYQTLIQRGLSAESDEVAKKSFLYGGAISLVWYMVPFLVGIIALVIFPNTNPEEAFMSMTTLFGTFGSLVFAVIIVASCISTLSSTILTTASNISHDIYKQWINPQASEKSVVLVSRISVVGVAIAGTLIGRSLPYILELLLTGGKIMAASLAPVLLALVFWKAARTAYYSTISAMILGALGTILGVILGNQTAASDQGNVVFVWALDPILVGLPITLVILIFGTLIENKLKRNKLTGVMDFKKVN
ncbi:sodium:solute symporter family protein [Oceanobacillus bengalensis]|uniref:Sodium:solute symporter family protein n=1 Tax=Oceanobacillus bengalensis TaxID=1435466 RepID=A0A494YSY5_9BACI|nr:sodium:solute symporter family protein [Oceanobacillus bengalensis]RKQ13184.1 sodium:solute symporter family protein [Oceanobacillus bengalensis]